MAAFTNCAPRKCGHFTEQFSYSSRKLALIQVMSQNNKTTTFISSAIKTKIVFVDCPNRRQQAANY
jgi:hypothetical protein